jgi:hypothetical protein
MEILGVSGSLLRGNQQADFKKALEQKLSSDPSTVDLRRVTRSVNMVSATERVRDVRDQHHTATFSGGAIGGGKKR